MPKKTKGGSRKGKTAPEAKDFAAKYIRLRTIIDAIEIGSLRYVLTATSPEERIKREEKLIAKLQPLAKRISHWIEADESTAKTSARSASDVARGADDPCPDGYYLCHGMCLPYPCPPDSDN